MVNQKGLSLVELMIGIAISLILLTGVLTVMLRVTTGGAESVTSTRLNQQLRSSLDQVSKDLQRAGYVDWFDAWDGCTDGTTDDVLDDINGDGNVDILDYYECSLPAVDRFGAISLWGFPTPGTATGTPTACTTNCDCVLFSYDLNEDGLQGIGGGVAGANQNTDNFELFGYRWNDGAIEIRTAGSVHSCNTGTWQDITDPNVTVTAMTFAMTYANAVATGNDSTVFQLSGTGTASGPSTTCVPNDTDVLDPIPLDGDTICLWRRSIGINVVGVLATDATVQVSLVTRVKTKNDYLDTP